MSQHVIVIGGGFAGLSAATALSERGFRVTVLEGRQVLGGRAYSFSDPQTGDSVDNGQHLFMGCYHETQAFLKRIGTLEAIDFQQDLRADFAAANGRTARLSCLPLPAPWHLLSGLMRLSTLSWMDRFRLIYIHQALKEAAKNKASLDQITVEQWLIRWKQSPVARRHLWDLIAIATLNEDPSIAAAGPFVEVLLRAFFDGRKDSQLGFSVVGLSDLYTHAAKTFIEARGGKVFTKSPVARFLLRNGRVEGVQLREGERLMADFVVSSVTAPALLKMLPAETVAAEPVFQRMMQLRSSPIISIHLWFDRAISRRAFVGMLDTNVQWFFNKSKILASSKTKQGYVSVVISGAHKFADWPETRIQAMAMEELRRLFPEARKAALLRSLVIKEHQATLSPSVGCETLRPVYQSPIQNLWLAGDWTRTGLPATIESACVSGHACAEIISRHCEERSDVAISGASQSTPEIATPAKSLAGSR